jgi:exosortase
VAASLEIRVELVGDSVMTTKLARSQAGFFAFGLISLLVGWRPLVQTFSLAFRDDEYTHILLILPVSAALIFLDWKALRGLIVPRMRAGSVLLLTAILIAFCAHGRSASVTPDIQLSIAMCALVMGWIGAFVFWFGSRATRLALFPLCFLFGVVPIPRFALDEIVSLLQEGSAWAAHALFAMMGVPVDQNGVFLTIPGLIIQVAQECSSIRSSSMLIVTTAVLAQLLLRSPWRKMLVIAVAIPLSVVKNGIRICTIAMLGTRIDPGYLTGRLHHQGGIIFFAIALFGIFALLWWLRRGDNMPLASTRGNVTDKRQTGVGAY